MVGFLDNIFSVEKFFRNVGDGVCELCQSHMKSNYLLVQIIRVLFPITEKVTCGWSQ